MKHWLYVHQEQRLKKAVWNRDAVGSEQQKLEDEALDFGAQIYGFDAREHQRKFHAWVERPELHSH